MRDLVLIMPCFTTVSGQEEIGRHAFIRLMTWLSPAFPVGAYSYSHGLEWAIEAQLVRNQTSLTGWIEAILTQGTGRTDAVFFLVALRTAVAGNTEALDDVVEKAAAWRSTAELAMESMAQGTAFLQAVRAVWPHPLLDALAARLSERAQAPAYAVAVGVAAAAAGVPENLAVAAYLQALAGNLVSAGVRLIPLGQTDGLKVLASLEEVIHAVSDEAMEMTLDRIGGATLMVDWCSMRHETQYTRLFRS